MKIRPVNDRILVHAFKAPEQSAGGIIIPDQAQGEVQIGVVSAVGPGRGFDGPGRTLVSRGVNAEVLEERLNLRAAMQAQPGDIVAFGKYAGSKVEVGQTELFLLREDELVAIIEDLPQEWTDLNADVIALASKGGDLGPTDLKRIEPSPKVEADLAGNAVEDEPPPIRRIVEP